MVPYVEGVAAEDADDGAGEVLSSERCGEEEKNKARIERHHHLAATCTWSPIAKQISIRQVDSYIFSVVPGSR